MKRLYDLIKEYNENNALRFHVPSNKGLGRSELNCGFDITELDFSDNLNYPQNVIKMEEERIAAIFNARVSVISVNGSSAAIMCAMMCAISENDTVLIFDDAHISAYYAAIHIGAKIQRAYVSDHIAGVSLADVKKAVQKAHDKNTLIKACVLTSPTYYGCVCDTASITEYLHQNHISVICDEAHGTHFRFGANFPESAVSHRADFVINSGHKTINALTQTGILHINSESVSYETAKAYMRLFTSTSPSYILMLSLINAIDEISNDNSKLTEIMSWYNELRESLISIGAYRIINYEKYLKKSTFNFDPMKITVFGENLSAESLERQHNIYPEMSNNGLTVFALGLNTSKEDMEKLTNALITQAENDPLSQSSEMPIYSFNEYPFELINIRKAYKSEFELIPLSNCIGRISADFITVYPPGAPILIPGQTITDYEINYLDTYKKGNINGIINNTLKVVKKP